MPSRLAAPVLTVDAGKMHKVDPRNVESLFGMWMVFSKCAESIQEGKRLENLSWRLWNRETFCCEAQPHLATTPAINISLPRPSPKDVPELSRSVDSVASEDAEQTQTTRGTPFTRNPNRVPEDSEDSALSRSRGKEKHITAMGLEKMIINIKEKTDLKTDLQPLLSPIQAIPSMSDATSTSDITPRPSSPFPQIETGTSPSSSQLQNSSESCGSMEKADDNTSDNTSDKRSEHRGSDTSVSSNASSTALIKSGSVVHGFSPSQMSSSFRSKSKLSQEMVVPARPVQAGKLDLPKRSMFTLGGSSGDDESSFEDRMSLRNKRSSLSDGLTKKPLDKSKKQSFREIVQSRIEEADTEDEDVIESDDDESAILEEDEEEWEDSNSDAGKSPPDDKPMFKRQESKPNLTSRPSMLTLQLHEPQRASALANAASKSSPTLRRSRTSSPNGPSMPASPEVEGGLMMRGPESSRPVPIIATTTNTHPPAHSPRTTRRNMLATELPGSLRKHLLWERKQKSTTANAVLSRRHTSQNLARLREYPEPKAIEASEDTSKHNSWDDHYDSPWDYHTRAW